MRNPFVQIISHPGDGTAELDFEELMKVSRETHTLLEINNHSMAPIRHKTVAAPNNLELLQLAKKYETPVIFGSDAHFSAMIADYSNIMPLVEKQSSRMSWFSTISQRNSWLTSSQPQRNRKI